MASRELTVTEAAARQGFTNMEEDEVLNHRGDDKCFRCDSVYLLLEPVGSVVNCPPLQMVQFTVDTFDAHEAEVNIHLA